MSELLLSVSRASWAAHPNHGTQWDASKRLLALREKVLARDDYTCQACGWRSEQWQEVHHIDHDHRRHSEANLETRCPLCHQVAHLPLAAATAGGSIVWLPEIPQTTLNLLCITLFVVLRHQSNPWHGMARHLYGALQSRQTLMATEFGSSDPGHLAQALLRLPESADARRVVAPLRLLPTPTRFPNAIDYWEAAYFRTPPPESWDKLLPADIDLSGLLSSSRPETAE